MRQRHFEIDPLLAATADHAADDVDDAADRRQLVGEVHAPRLDLRDVEDVVDELQEVAARDQDVADVALLLVVEVAEELLLEQLREADDRVERRAQLVAHVREEGALGLVRRVGRLLGLAHLALGALALLDLALEPYVGVRAGWCASPPAHSSSACAARSDASAALRAVMSVKDAIAA